MRAAYAKGGVCDCRNNRLGRGRDLKVIGRFQLQNLGGGEFARSIHVYEEDQWKGEKKGAQTDHLARRRPSGPFLQPCGRHERPPPGDNMPYTETEIHRFLGGDKGRARSQKSLITIEMSGEGKEGPLERGMGKTGGLTGSQSQSPPRPSGNCLAPYVKNQHAGACQATFLCHAL